MKRQERKKQKRGFTLIEILIVVTIILVLAGFLLPAVMNAMVSAEKSEVRTACHRVKNAITAYETVYKKFPVTSGTSAEVFDGASSKAIIKALIGEDTTLNPKRETFLEIDNEELDGTYLDAWDKQYRIYLDTNVDGRISVGGTQLKQRIIVQSAGRDEAFYGGSPSSTSKSNDDIYTLKK